MNGGTLILTRRDVAALLSIEECTKAVEHVFRLYGEGKTLAPGMLGVPESKTLTICGCGVQGSISLRALIGLFPLEQVFA